MAGFYAILLILEIWFAFRIDIVAMAQTAEGAMGGIYRVLTLGSYDVSERALAEDHRWTKVLAAIGIAAAAGLHGYVGFVFGSLKSREWWSSDLMPIIFILSAVVSGVAVLTLIYVVSSKVRRAAIDENCVRGLARVLCAFLIVTMVIEALEYAEMMYRRVEGVEMVKQLIVGPISAGLTIQAVFSAIPLVILIVLLARDVRGRTLVGWMCLCSVLLMSAVLAMRWNVVIGGQELSKTAKGLITFTPPVWGREGVVWALSLLGGTFVLLWAMTRLLPPWEPVQMSE